MRSKLINGESGSLGGGSKVVEDVRIALTDSNPSPFNPPSSGEPMSTKRFETVLILPRGFKFSIFHAKFSPFRNTKKSFFKIFRFIVRPFLNSIVAT